MAGLSSGPLAGGFADVTYADWESLVRAGEKDPQRALTTELEEDLEVKWLYTVEDQLAGDPAGSPGVAPFVRGARGGRPWAIRQRTVVTDRETANRQILEDLEGGATEVLLAPNRQVTTVEELDAVLTGVLLDLAPIAIDSEATGDNRVAELLLEIWRRRGHERSEVRGSLGLGPSGIALLRAVGAEFPKVKVISVDTTGFVGQGAGAVYELALALALATSHLREADAVGIAPAELAAALEFTLASGPDQFLEIAKLRAFRRLWATVLEHCGVPSRQRRSDVYVQTSRRMVSSLDPWVNILRATTATFAAAVGGADGITVLPFDEPYRQTVTEAGPLGRRIARNTQLVLAHEAFLHRVDDPAGGSWYVESLTDQVARRAWAEFQAIEAGGGLSSAAVPARLREATAGRHAEIAHRRRSLTGVNQFPLLGDDGLDRAQAHARPLAAPTGVRVDTRDAAQFEALRARAAELQPPPRILLACVGPLAAHAGAAQWAKGFFEAGGVEAVPSGVEPDIAALVTRHGFTVAAVCAGRDVDPEPLAAELRAAGVTHLYAAGADLDGAQRVRDGVDMVAVLGALLDRFQEEAE
jgi:methylmalonyl-CoA mutase